MFLQHALLDSSAAFVISGAHQSLGFILADAGYDVRLPTRPHGRDMQHYQAEVKIWRRRRIIMAMASWCHRASHRLCGYSIASAGVDGQQPRQHLQPAPHHLGR